ncbi:NifU family protein, partial [archaeon]
MAYKSSISTTSIISLHVPHTPPISGNVRVAGIDGPIVKLELQGACGSCPSSAMTMKMG